MLKWNAGNNKFTKAEVSSKIEHLPISGRVNKASATEAVD